MNSDHPTPIPRRTFSQTTIIASAVVFIALLIACGQTADGVPQPGSIAVEGAPTTSTAAPVSAAPASIEKTGEQTGPEPYLVFNQKWLEGLRSTDLDVKDVGEVFSYIFSKLPDEVVVYPTE